MKVAEAAKGRVRKGVGPFGSKTGSCECFEGSGLGDFFWLQLHAKLEHLSPTKKSAFLAEVMNN